MLNEAMLNKSLLQSSTKQHIIYYIIKLEFKIKLIPFSYAICIRKENSPYYKYINIVMIILHETQTLPKDPHNLNHNMINIYIYIIKSMNFLRN